MGIDGLKEEMERWAFCLSLSLLITRHLYDMETVPVYLLAMSEYIGCDDYLEEIDD